MTYKRKVIIVENIISDIAALIYTIFLVQYNKILYEIQSRYDNKFIQALNVVKEPHFYTYFFLGILFAGLLIWNSVRNYRFRKELEIATIILILLNCCFLIALIIAYSNPIFTTMITLLTVAGIIVAANQ